MPQKNRYRGVLKPLLLGKGSPEIALALIYDVEDDRLRARVADICLNYGLERIQFSAFFGRLNRNRRQELALRLHVPKSTGSRHESELSLCARMISATCGCSIVATRLEDAGKGQAAVSDRPRLKILRPEDV